MKGEYLGHLPDGHSLEFYYCHVCGNDCYSHGFYHEANGKREVFCDSCHEKDLKNRMPESMQIFPRGSAIKPLVGRDGKLY